MKRKFKHLCSTIQPIKQNVSTKRTITYLLNSLNIQRTTTYNVRNTGSSLGLVQKLEIQVPVWDRYKNVAGLNRLM